MSYKGKIKFIQNEKGFGFISRDSGEDIFFRLSEMSVGVDVEYDTAADPKKPGKSLAIDVVIVGSDGPDNVCAEVRRFFSNKKKTYNMSEQYYGQITHVDPVKGFGFIKLTGGDKLFFHVTQLVVPLAGNTRSGTGVRFKVMPDENKGGYVASQVEIIDDAGDDELRQRIANMVDRKQWRETFDSRRRQAQNISATSESFEANEVISVWGNLRKKHRDKEVPT
jgi:cold shock CspA family protein